MIIGHPRPIWLKKNAHKMKKIEFELKKIAFPLYIFSV